MQKLRLLAALVQGEMVAPKPPDPCLHTSSARFSENFGSTLLHRPFFFSPSLAIPELGSRDRMGAFKELIDLLSRADCVTDSLGFLQAVLDREDQQSTALPGYGVALPHARCRSVSRASFAVGISRQGIVFPSESSAEPVRVICLLAVPNPASATFLSLLGRISACFERPGFLQGLMACRTPHDIYYSLDRHLSESNPGLLATAGCTPCL